MRLVNRIPEFREELDHARRAGQSVGLVPTMGALHEGHVSLVRRSAAECDVTAVTVFVNPLQFGPHEDLASYPRDLEGDVAAATEAGASFVFAPTVAEMYPGRQTTVVRVDDLSTTLEGSSRPGHLAGMATVVAKLLNVAGPCRAYFGEKDYQQLLVVRRLVADLSFPVVVVGCPTVREADGLARSSRNARLAADQRRAATVLNRALEMGQARIVAGEVDPAVVARTMAEVVAAETLVRLDYAEVAAADSLRPLERLEGEVRLLVSAWAGGTRLIDNLGTTVPSSRPDLARTVGPSKELV